MDKTLLMVSQNPLHRQKKESNPKTLDSMEVVIELALSKVLRKTGSAILRRRSFLTFGIELVNLI